MKVYIKLFLLIVFVFYLIFLSACGNNYLQTDTKKNIDVIVKMEDNDYWKVVQMGAEAAGKEFGVNVNFNAPDSEEDIDGQIAIVNKAIEMKSDAIILAASDYKRLVEVVQKAYSAKIPIIIIDSAIDSENIKSFIATDNRVAGRRAGEKIIAVVGEKCNIAIMNFVKGTAPAEQREIGLTDILSKYPNIKIVAKEYCLSDTKLSSSLTRKIVKEHPEVNVIVGLNAMATTGVVETIDQMKLTDKIKIFGFDSTPEEIQALEDGVIQATVVQKPFNMGYLGVKYALWAINGKAVPKLVDTGSQVIDKSNMYTPENQKLLFPFVK